MMIKITIISVAFFLASCASTESPSVEDSNQIHADKKYIHPKFNSNVTKQQFQIFRVHNEQSLLQIWKDTNNQIHEGFQSKLNSNFKESVYFFIKESENPDKPDLFEIDTILLNGSKGTLHFLADYDHLLIKTVVTNTQISGKRERNHHISEKIVPIKRTESTENLYNVPRKVSDKVMLIRSKRYIYQFPKKILLRSSNQLRILIDEVEHTFSFDHFDEI